MDVTWEEIAPDFQRITSRIVWCSVTTQDRKGRLRSRILHPVWDGKTGWIATGRNSLKAKHLAKNPYVSLSYWDNEREQVLVECKASWADNQGNRDTVWELIKNAPPPVGYDPALFWQAGSTDPNYGALLLEPWRIELWSMAELMQGKPARVWHA